MNRRVPQFAAVIEHSFTIQDFWASIYLTLQNWDMAITFNRFAPISTQRNKDLIIHSAEKTVLMHFVYFSNIILKLGHLIPVSTMCQMCDLLNHLIYCYKETWATTRATYSLLTNNQNCTCTSLNYLMCFSMYCPQIATTVI